MPKRNCANSPSFRPMVRAEAICENHNTILSEYSSGVRDSASTPPAMTSCERPSWMLAMAESIACMPEHLVAATEPQGNHAPDIDLVGARSGAADDHLVELFRRKRLARQQGAAGDGCQIGSRERPRQVA